MIRILIALSEDRGARKRLFADYSHSTLFKPRYTKNPTPAELYISSQGIQSTPLR